MTRLSISLTPSPPRVQAKRTTGNMRQLTGAQGNVYMEFASKNKKPAGHTHKLLRDRAR